jgi:hypothetical protein
MMAIVLKINGDAFNTAASPSKVTNAYTPIPIECAQAHTTPCNLPPLSVCLTTIAKLGPGDMAPKQQIARSPSQALNVITPLVDNEQS